MPSSFVTFPHVGARVRGQGTSPHAQESACAPRPRHLRAKACASAHAPRAAAPPEKKAGWQCMRSCGACCKLDDFEDDVLRDMLKSDADVAEYLSLIDARTGWCKHFDSTERTCTVYDARPRFCRATPAVFEALYDVPRDGFDAFAIDCCTFHIANTYGEHSHEADRYARFVRAPAPASGSAPQT